MQKMPVFGLILLTLGVMVLSACGGGASSPTATQPQPAADIPATNVPTIAITEAPAASVQDSDLISGGLMYDNWMKVVGVDAPEGEPPLWKTQTTNTRTGADTWRCKECHGWDYKGAEGAYGSGSHQTGFPGLIGAAAMSEEDLLAWLNGTKNPDHDFSPFIPEDQLQMLVGFLKGGLTDTAQYINADKTLNGGDVEHGQQIFTDTCEECHAADGKNYNFGSESEPEYLGTIAADNPWEFWHKVTFGQPGVEKMPSAVQSGWVSQDIVDLLAFAQTLPAE